MKIIQNKVFAENSTKVQFGSPSSDAILEADKPEEIEGSIFLKGTQDANIVIDGIKKSPTLEDYDSVFYHLDHSLELGSKEGIAEFDENAEYIDFSSFCSEIAKQITEDGKVNLVYPDNGFFWGGPHGEPTPNSIEKILTEDNNNETLEAIESASDSVYSSIDSKGGKEGVSAQQNLAKAKLEQAEQDRQHAFPQYIYPYNETPGFEDSVTGAKEFDFLNFRHFSRNTINSGQVPRGLHSGIIDLSDSSVSLINAPANFNSLTTAEKRCCKITWIVRTYKNYSYEDAKTMCKITVTSHTADQTKKPLIFTTNVDGLGESFAYPYKGSNPNWLEIDSTGVLHSDMSIV